MKLLDALNTALPYLNAPAATSVTSKHPTIGALLAAFDVARQEVLDLSLWFNTRTVYLYPDASTGVIFSPSRVRSLYPIDTEDIIEPRGDTLFNLTQNTTVFTDKVQFRVVDDLDFSDLPAAAAGVVLYKGAASVYVAKFGMDNTAQLLMKNQRDQEILLQREHLRKKQFNILNISAAQNIITALRGG